MSASGYLNMIITVILLTGCRNGVVKKSENSGAGKETVHTGRLSIRKFNDYSVITISDPWQGAANVHQIFYLVKRGNNPPSGALPSSVIYTPVEKIICMSTTYLAMIEALGETNSVTGVSGTDFIYSPRYLQNVENGSLIDVGYESNLNKEVILKLSPDLIMIYGIGGESSGYVGKIKELGIKVMMNADYLETEPLKRLEWIKLFGALYEKEEMADSIFSAESDEYNKLKEFLSEKAVQRPKVLLGLPFKDTWYISPGNSFISTLISDAAGTYLWNDTRSQVSMPYGIENVYMRAVNADFWLNISSVNSKDEIRGIDKRLTELPCFRSGNLFNNNKRVTIKGGNDYWESGSVYPHLLLKDIAAILHPELFSGNELMYYIKLE
jgi:iron complex transport system substrate-binding protein